MRIFVTILAAMALSGVAAAQDEDLSPAEIASVLTQVAANYSLPQSLDPTTTLVDVRAIGLILNFHYTLNEHGSAANLRAFFVRNRVSMICGDENVEWLFGQGVTFRYTYTILDESEPVVIDVNDAVCAH